MRNTGWQDWRDAEHLNRTDSLPSAREAYLKSLTDNLTKKNIIRLAFMAGFMTSAAIFLYYFITQLGLRDEKLGSDAPRWLTLIANGTGNNVSDLPPPSGIPPTLPLHISNNTALPSIWNLNCSQFQEGVYPQRAWNITENAQPWTALVDTLGAITYFFVNSFFKASDNNNYNDTAYDRDAMRFYQSASRAIIDRCAWIQNHPELCDRNPLPVFSNSTPFTVYNKLEYNVGWWNMITAVNITLNCSADDVEYSRQWKPLINSAAGFCLSLALLAIPWKTRNSTKPLISETRESEAQQTIVNVEREGKMVSPTNANNSQAFLAAAPNSDSIVTRPRSGTQPKVMSEQPVTATNRF